MPTLDWSIAELMAATDLSEYRFFIFQTIDLTTERDDGIMTCRTRLWQESGKFFINAFVEEYADVLVNNRELAERMTDLGWTHIARSVAVDRYWTEVYDPEEDQLVETNGA